MHFSSQSPFPSFPGTEHEALADAWPQLGGSSSSCAGCSQNCPPSPGAAGRCDRRERDAIPGTGDRGHQSCGDSCGDTEHRSQSCGDRGHPSQSCGDTEHRSQSCGDRGHPSQSCGDTEHRSQSCGDRGHPSQSCGDTEHRSQSCGDSCGDTEHRSQSCGDR
uniref:Uncharacterized protein n=1 Tax=Ficedula albicollis TaxID=59894 RepID=A0A803W6Y7_FICAL